MKCARVSTLLELDNRLKNVPLFKHDKTNYGTQCITIKRDLIDIDSIDVYMRIHWLLFFPQIKKIQSVMLYIFTNESCETIVDFSNCNVLNMCTIYSCDMFTYDSK